MAFQKEAKNNKNIIELTSDGAREIVFLCSDKFIEKKINDGFFDENLEAEMISAKIRGANTLFLRLNQPKRSNYMKK